MSHLLFISQVYIPDPTSVGQHMADVAEEMVKRGWKVTVITSASGYDNPDLKFPNRETLNGVDVRRMPFSSFGKKTILHRLLGQGLFSIQTFLRSLFLPKVDAIFVTTSPPIGGAIGALVSKLRSIPMHFWVMDLNPDQAIEQGLVSADSLPARIFNSLNRFLLKQASSIIALDEFMAERLKAKNVKIEEKLHILPPWPMEEALEIIDKDKNPFIQKHALEGKFVLMYSGNHSPVHPLETFLEAALILKDRKDIEFLFVGGGKAKETVNHFIEEHPDAQVRSLPYQPLDQIKYSLSAADVHLVSMGAPMVGCVHPCKFYGAMALRKPILYLGPLRSHIGRIIETSAVGWQIEHDAVEELVDLIKKMPTDLQNELLYRGESGKALVTQSLGKEALCKKLCDLLEKI